jgi:hypothetical protein
MRAWLRQPRLHPSSLNLHRDCQERRGQTKPPSKSEEYERFEAFAKELVLVPKAVIDKRAEEYERQKRKRSEKKLPKPRE